MNVTLFGNWVFADVIKLKRHHTGLAWVLIPNDWCLYKKRNKDTRIQGEGHEQIQVENGGMWPQARKCQGLPATTSS